MKGDPGLGQVSIPRLARAARSNKVKLIKFNKQLITSQPLKFYPFAFSSLTVVSEIPFVLSANTVNQFEHNDMFG